MPGEPKKPQLPDWIRDYRASVRSKLRPAANAGALQSLDFCFFPAFHAEAFLSLARTETATTAHFATFDISEWSFRLRKRHPEMVARPLDQVLPRPPRRISQTRSIDPEAAEKFWCDMDASRIAGIESDDRCGADGISIEVRWVAHPIEHEFEFWSPQMNSSNGRVTTAALAMALECFDSEIVLKRLTQLRCYLIRPSRNEDIQAFLSG